MRQASADRIDSQSAGPGRADRVRVAIVVVSNADGDLTVTLDSLARQEGIDVQAIVTGPGPAATDELTGTGDPRHDDSSGADRALNDRLRGCRPDFVTFVRAGDVVLPRGVRVVCDALREAPAAAMAHPLWMPRQSDGSIPRAAALRHVQQLREAGAEAWQHALATTNRIPALTTFRADWLIDQPDFEVKSLDRDISRLIRGLSSTGRVLTVMSVTCASTSSLAFALKPPARVALRNGVLQFASTSRGMIPRAMRLVRARLHPGAGAWDALGAFLRRRSFAGLARVPMPRNRPGDQLVAYYQPRYPSFSETFIRREVKALRDAGVRLQVFALESGDVALLDAEATPGVVYFGPENPVAGREFIATALSRRPWRVITLALWIVRSGRDSWWRRDLKILYLAGQLAAALERAKVTHVHAPWADRHSVVAFVASRLIDATFSTQARASEIHRARTGRGLPDRVRFAEFVITNSTYNERYLRQVMDAGAPRLHVIRNGLDLNQFPMREPSHRATDPFRLLAVGRLVEPKGFKHLLRACRELLDRGHDITCEIIGGPVDPMDTVTWVELQMLHARLELGSRVVFRGPQPFATVTEAFRRADAFVLPCVRGRDGSHDITPNSLIEAMAMQLAVVSTTSGAIPEIVDHEMDGLLVPPGDASALASALERLIKDDALRQRLGAAARRKIEDRFDARRNAALRVHLFESLPTHHS